MKGVPQPEELQVSYSSLGSTLKKPQKWSPELCLWNNLGFLIFLPVQFPDQQPEFPIITRKYYVQFMFLEGRPPNQTILEMFPNNKPPAAASPDNEQSQVMSLDYFLSFSLNMYEHYIPSHQSLKCLLHPLFITATCRAAVRCLLQLRTLLSVADWYRCCQNWRVRVSQHGFETNNTCKVQHNWGWIKWVVGLNK